MFGGRGKVLTGAELLFVALLTWAKLLFVALLTCAELFVALLP